MFRDLDRTLRELLRHELPPEIVSPSGGTPVTISFATPDKDFGTRTGQQLPAINLFLYDIRENLELRSTPWSVTRNNGNAIKKRNPVRVDCSYLITAWYEGGEEEEHWALGEVAKVLLRHRTIPAAVLQGSFQGQEPPLRSASLTQGQLQSLGEFWQAIGGKPRAALNYTVTIAMDVDQSVEVGPVVKDILIT